MNTADLLALLVVLVVVSGLAALGAWWADGETRRTPPRSRDAQIADELARRRALRAANRGKPLTKPAREARRDAFMEYGK